MRSFEDRFSGGIGHYITWLKERVQEMYRILKPTGSIFLHCDWHANAYVRVDILDKIFGYNRLLNEIIWKRATSGSSKSIAKRLGTDHDVIFWYSKSDKFTFKPVWLPYPEKEIEKRFTKSDSNGYYKDAELATYSKEKLEQLKKENRLIISPTGKYRYKIYLKDIKGVLADDIWTHIPPVNSQAKERIGYPTQKPEALLQRIIEMASDENDIILDPFVGGGTTVMVAEKLHRRWIGIDQSVQAIKVTEMRLQRDIDLFRKPFTVQLYKYDYDTLRYKDAFEFETWIIERFGGQPNTKKGGDLGVDGKSKNNTPIQVKRSDGIGRNIIDNFKSACERYNKKLYDKNIAEKLPIGYIIAFSFGKGAREEVARLKNKENIQIELVLVENIVPIAKKPLLRIEVQNAGTLRDAPPDKGLFIGILEVEFTAIATASAGIEFFAWDLNYKESKGFKPDILLDINGKQRLKLKPGSHTIAVKVIDKDGLENIEAITVKINGKITVL